MFQPLGNKVLVKADIKEQTSKQKLLLMSERLENANIGTIKALGTGNSEELKHLQIGDKIIYQRFGPIQITLNGEKFTIVSIDEILGVYK